MTIAIAIAMAVRTVLLCRECAVCSVCRPPQAPLFQQEAGEGAWVEAKCWPAREPRLRHDPKRQPARAIPS